MLKQCHKPPMTGNGKVPPLKVVMTGGCFMTLFYPHYINQHQKTITRYIKQHLSLY
jgi:hypothetical protein